MHDQFIIDHGENAVVDGPVVAVGYASGGKEVGVEDAACLAKRVTDPATGHERYWLKRATSGAEAGKLYNPHSPAFEPERQGRFNERMGRSQYEFAKAGKDAFIIYLRFLVSGNLLHLRQAEREF